VQALAIANYYRDEWPLLIIAPSSVKYMWKESVLKWLPNVIEQLSIENDTDDVIQVLENTKQTVHDHTKIVVCSYDLLVRMIDYLVKCSFKVVIADECHFLKNGKAERTKAALKVFEKCARAIFLSGTPALSRPAELYSQISAINPTLFGSFGDFGMRYCDGKETNYGMDYSGSSNMKELQLVLEEKIMIRREKKDVITQLPTKLREMIILDPSLIELEKKSLKQASSQMANEKLKGMEKRGALLTFFSETSKAKARAVCEYIREFLDSGKKFIVFAHHQSMLDAIQAECEQGKYDYIRIDGCTHSEKRTVSVEKFQTNEKCRIAILSITAANSGITLTEASLVLFAELFWNPGILVQAEDRVYRIGQRNSVLIQYLCAKSTADDYIWPLVNEKLSVLSKAGLTRENLSNASTVSNFSNSTNKIDNYFGSEDTGLDELIMNEELFSQIQSSFKSTDTSNKPVKMRTNKANVNIGEISSDKDEFF
jgi:SWI/SNF-related matrix-associated actin-dependent regulator 1 of chromatin subfamily A